MYRRYSNVTRQLTAGACVLLFAACGSNPPAPEAPPPVVASSNRSASSPQAESAATATTPATAKAAPATTAPAKTEPAPTPAAKPTKTAKASKGDSKNEASEAVAPPAEPLLPPEAVQQFDRAVVLMSSGDAAAAEQGFRALASAYPSYSGPLLNLGILQAKAGRLEEAEKTIKSALERNSASAAGFNQLGIVYRKLGRFKDADEAYQRALQIDPNYALAHLNLGVLCDLYLQQPQRALQAYERYLALAASPDAKVSSWVSELKKRIGSEPRAARAAEALISTAGSELSELHLPASRRSSKLILTNNLTEAEVA